MSHTLRLVYACVSVAGAIVGCGSPTDLAGLPADLPDSIKTVHDNSVRFAAPTSGPAATTAPGTVVDPLATLAGCWGAFTPDVAQGTEAVPIEDYSALRFAADGGFEWWDIETAVGYSVLDAQRGSFEVTANNRIRITVRELVSYNPFSKQFETDSLTRPDVTEYLITRVGDVLLLLMIDPTGDGQTPVDASGRIVLHAFDCP